MSSNYWQTKKLGDQYGNGRTATDRVRAYIKTWKNRCYSEIPDEIPAALMTTNRAPSYKSIAIAILKNDLQLYSLGFSKRDSDLCLFLKREKKDAESKQMNLDL